MMKLKEQRIAIHVHMSVVKSVNDLYCYVAILNMFKTGVCIRRQSFI